MGSTSLVFENSRDSGLGVGFAYLPEIAIFSISDATAQSSEPAGSLLILFQMKEGSKVSCDRSRR